MIQYLYPKKKETFVQCIGSYLQRTVIMRNLVRNISFALHTTWTEDRIFVPIEKVGLHIVRLSKYFMTEIICMIGPNSPQRANFRIGCNKTPSTEYTVPFLFNQSSRIQLSNTTIGLKSHLILFITMNMTQASSLGQETAARQSEGLRDEIRRIRRIQKSTVSPDMLNSAVKYMPRCFVQLNQSKMHKIRARY